MKDEHRFLQARDGNGILQPFQYDLCWFKNLQLRDPNTDAIKDVQIIARIRRVNLDVCWSQATSTVRKIWICLRDQ